MTLTCDFSAWRKSTGGRCRRRASRHDRPGVPRVGRRNIDPARGVVILDPLVTMDVLRDPGSPGLGRAHCQRGGMQPLALSYPSR
jgi:hypothetical protein